MKIYNRYDRSESVIVLTEEKESKTVNIRDLLYLCIENKKSRGLINKVSSTVLP